MSEKRGVLEMDKDKRMLTFPGPGGYTITWAPGAVRIPLQDAMSKHAMIPCARFDQVTPKSQQGGLPTKKMTFHATSKDEPTTEPQGQSSATPTTSLPSFSGYEWSQTGTGYQLERQGSSSSGLVPEERSSVPVHPTH